MPSNNLFEHADSFSYYKPINNIKKFKYYFKMIDAYALPITLRYKNQRKFYTNFGALATFIIYITMLSLASSSFSSVGNRDDIRV